MYIEIPNRSYILCVVVGIHLGCSVCTIGLIIMYTFEIILCFNNAHTYTYPKPISSYTSYVNSDHPSCQDCMTEFCFRPHILHTSGKTKRSQHSSSVIYIYDEQLYAFQCYVIDFSASGRTSSSWMTRRTR